MPALGWAAFRIAVAVERGRQPRITDVVTLLRFVVRHRAADGPGGGPGRARPRFPTTMQLKRNRERRLWRRLERTLLRMEQARLLSPHAAERIGWILADERPRELDDGTWS